jgi:SWI/SNF-related matrix-associated actin-dependent regulator of chromatin subfamily A-like protein 1
MIGYFWINLADKKIHIRLPVTAHHKGSKKLRWFLEELDLRRPAAYFKNSLSEWVVKLKKDKVKQLLKLGFDTEPWTFNYAYGPTDRTYKSYKLKDDLKFLRLFQRDGVRYITSKNGRAILALEPGLGKTPTSLGYAIQHPTKTYPILVVCPATVKEQWKSEYNKFIGKGTVKVLYGRDSLDKYEGVDVVIVNYELLAYNMEKSKSVDGRNLYKPNESLKQFIRNNFQYLIIDEFHYIKSDGKNINKYSKAYKAVRKISREIPNVVALSGTPFENGPAELFNILEIVRPDVYKNRLSFYERYCGPETSNFGTTYTGATLTNELHRRLVDTCMFRLKKENVLKELPPVTPSVIPIRLQKYKEYAKYKNELEKEIKDPTNKLIAANKFEKLLQKSYELKKDVAFKFIDDELLKKDKVVLFCWHTKAVKELSDRYGAVSVKIDGSTPSEKRSLIKEEFVTNPEKKLFIGNIQSAGTGLDGLQKVCDTVIFLELTWKPTKIDQAIDRVNRMGFTGDKIFLYYLVALDTIEEDLAELLDKKRRKFDKVIDGEETAQFDLLEELIKRDQERI